MSEVGGAVLVRRGADADELESAVGYAFGGVGGELEAAGFGVAVDYGLEAGFVDGDFALV